MKKTWRKKKSGWDRFHRWEKAQSVRHFEDQGKNLRMTGDSVDFFLSRHPQRSERPDVSGIQKMREGFSKIPLS